MKKRIGILLAGCGAVDGSDPQETVLIQLAVQESGHEAVCLSLDKPQYQVADHSTTAELPGEKRNQFLESQRLVRGKLHNISDIAPNLLDILIIPGGQGPIKSWLVGFSPGEERRLVPEVELFLKAFRKSGGVLGVLSLSEFVATALDGEWPEERGCLDLAPEEILVDAEKGRALSPGNLAAKDLPQLQSAIQVLLQALLRMADAATP